MVVVWALDRLARSLRQLLTIADECRVLGVDIVSLKQNLDTTLPAGRLTFQVLGAVAEFEREMLRERVKAGMNQARRVGTHIGRPPRRKLIPIEIQEIRLLQSSLTVSKVGFTPHICISFGRVTAGHSPFSRS